MTSPTVRVHADLTVRVDDHTVVVTADGSRVRLTLSDPGGLIDAVTSVALPVGQTAPFTRRSLVRTADTLAAGGLTVVVDAPTGRLATLGAEAAGGRWLRFLLRTDHVALGERSSWAGVARPVVTAAVRRLRTAVSERVRRPR